MHNKIPPLPRAFVWKRLHSLMGLWLVLFLIIHLLANSQAALFLGENGQGFIKAANDIHSLPYLLAIEILLLGIPFAIHIIWGVQALLTAEPNSFASDGSKPSLPEYPRNKAYTWQRITSWLLLILITAHVIQMRVMEAPTSARRGEETTYMVRLNGDPGLYPLAVRLGVMVYEPKQVQEQVENFQKMAPLAAIDPQSPQDLVKAQAFQHEEHWIEALTARPLQPHQVIAATRDFGTAELLMVRETFKMPVMLVLYTVLVLSACFHAFNGLWTCMITWGVTLSVYAQNRMKKVAIGFMILLSLLGLAAIWGTYWVNLYQ